MHVKVNSQSPALLHFIFIFCFLTVITPSCSVSKQISRQAGNLLLKDTAIRSGHIGICIYEPATGKYWYAYNAGKYFLPASTTKLFTLYAGMKYLGDSLPGLRIIENKNSITILPTGDPSFLHPDFKQQNVYDYLKNAGKPIVAPFYAENLNRWGPGWAWDDYNDVYMSEISALPIYANVFRFSGTMDNVSSIPKGILINPAKKFSGDGGKGFIDRVKRDFKENDFTLFVNGRQSKVVTVPFITSEKLSHQLLSDTLGKAVSWNQAPAEEREESKKFLIHSQASDSLFRPMMHRSDNFFAEQTLLMVSNELLGKMDTRKAIDSLLINDFKDIPQKPRWVDGSGLSRYNMFTPESFVYLLDKIKKEFGFDRIKNILPTGGTGTLGSYYVTEKDFIYAKTGTLSNHTALCGYLITKNNKLLVFSLMANNFQSGATPVRKAFERFLKGIRETY